MTIILPTNKNKTCGHVYFLYFWIKRISFISLGQNPQYADLSAYWGLVFVLHQCAFAWCKVLCRFFTL